MNHIVLLLAHLKYLVLESHIRVSTASLGKLGHGPLLSFIEPSYSLQGCQKIRFFFSPQIFINSIMSIITINDHVKIKRNAKYHGRNVNGGEIDGYSNRF